MSCNVYITDFRKVVIYRLKILSEPNFGYFRRIFRLLIEMKSEIMGEVFVSAFVLSHVVWPAAHECAAPPVSSVGVTTWYNFCGGHNVIQLLCWLYNILVFLHKNLQILCSGLPLSIIIWWLVTSCVYLWIYIPEFMNIIFIIHI